MLTLLVCNSGIVLYSHLGLSLRVKTNLSPDATAGQNKCDMPSRRLEEQSSGFSLSSSPALGRQLQAGNCNADDIALWQAGDKKYWDEIADECGTGCGFQMISSGQCFAQCHQDDAGLSATCASCFGDKGYCTVTKCWSTCLPPNQLSDECAACTEDQCSEFPTCHGMGSWGTGPTPVSTQQNSTATPTPTLMATLASTQDEATIEYFSVGPEGDLSFTNSISRSWENNAQALAVLILVASGVNPYLENVLLGIAWMVPMKPSSRSWLLWFVNRFGRWSFVDVFCVIILVVGLDFSMINGELDIKAESKAAIYVFGLATIWARLQGAAVEVYHKPTMKSSGEHSKSLPRLRLWLWPTSAASVLLIAIGLAAPFVSFQTIDVTFNREQNRQYSLISLGYELANHDISGYWAFFFMAIPYFIYALVLPLFTSLAVLLGLCLPSVFNRVVAVGSTFGSASSLDVLMLSAVVAVTHYGKLLDATIDCFKTNPDDPDIVSASGDVCWGFGVLLAACPAQWIMHECLLAAHNANGEEDGRRCQRPEDVRTRKMDQNTEDVGTIKNSTPETDQVESAKVAATALHESNESNDELTESV